jgi:hypothetical protein
VQDGKTAALSIDRALRELHATNATSATPHHG